VAFAPLKVCPRFQELPRRMNLQPLAVDSL
jgi:hypothetical protein